MAALCGKAALQLHPLGQPREERIQYVSAVMYVRRE